jgi:hypothetical protein
VALYIAAIGLSFLSQWMALCIYVMVALSPGSARRSLG